MKSFDQFMQDWLGKRVDYDHVYAYQCVDLTLEYIYECFGISSAYGNAIDWWNNPSKNLFPTFSKVGGSEAIKGDIVVLNGVAGNPYGHIGIATGNDNATQVQILEQNGQTGTGTGEGGDAIRTRYVPKSRIAGLLRPMANTATVVQSAPHVPYVVTTIDPKQVITNKQPTYKWGMNYDNFEAMSAHPITTVAQGTIMTVVALVTHINGYKYYKTDMTDPDGWNILDCDDYTPPAAPKVTINQNVQIPTSRDEYRVVTQINAYSSPVNALKRTGATKILSPGAYYKFTELNGMLSLTKTLGSTERSWINPADNVEAPSMPVVNPDDISNDWQKTLHKFPKAMMYKALEDIDILDIAGLSNVGIPVKAGEKIPMLGTFVRNNLMYLYCHLASDKERVYYYGVPVTNPGTGAPLMISDEFAHMRVIQPQMARDYRKAEGVMTTEDHIYYFQQMIARAVNSGVRFIDVIIPHKVKAFLKGEDKE